MKVSFCPNCRISPDITTEEVKCPKCGKTAKGENLNETVTKWNNGEYSTITKVKPVIEEVEKPEEKPEERTEERARRPRRRRSE